MFQRTGNLPYLSAILNSEWPDSFCGGKNFLSSKLDCTLGHTIELDHVCQVELISRYFKAQWQEIVIQIHRMALFLEAQTQISLLKNRYQQMEALMKSYVERADGRDHGKSYEKDIPTKIRLDGRTSKDTSYTDPVQNSNSFQSGICSVYCGLNSLNYIKGEHIIQTPLPDVDVPTQIFQISNTEEELTIQKSHRKHMHVEMCLAYRKRPSFLYDCIEVNVAAVIMDCWFYEQNHLELKMLHSALKMVLYERTAHGTKYQNTSSCQRHAGICSAESREVSCRLDENVHIEQVFHNDHENAVEKTRIEETNCIPKKKTVKAKCETGVSTENITKKDTSNRGIYKKRSWRMFELVNVWLILQAFLSSVCGAPHPTEPNGLNKETVQRKQLLLTTDCNHGNFYDLNQYCQTDSVLLKLLIGNCHFKALCSSEEEPICINTQNKGVFVCEKKNLKCAKGHMIRAWTDENNPDIINLQEQICPEGTFQPQTLDCQYACYYNHRNIDQISEKYIVYSQGDNKSPTMVYCNNTGGFFSQKEGTFLLDYDLEEEYSLNFCVKKNRSQLCKMDQYPLPNSTCTELCRDGYFRDDHDNFNCKPIEDRLSSGSSFATEVTDGNIHKELTTNAAAEKKQSNRFAVILTVVCVLVLVILVTIIACYCSKFDCKRGEQFRQYFARHIQTKGTNTTTYNGIHLQEPHTSEGDGTNDLEDAVNDDVIDHENNRNGVEDSGCERPLLIKQSEDASSSKPNQQNADNSNRIQVQPQGEPYDKGEPFKKPFDNTLNQYAMEHHTKLMQSVGALVVKQRPVGTPKRAGTVFRIGDLLLMTARHVIESIVDPENTGNANWLLLESDDVYVNFNASLINDARIKYRFKCICISDDPNLDFAILQVTNPTQLPLKMLLHKSDYERLNAKQLSIIGFGHTTEHNDKCIDPRCQILSPDSDRVLEAKGYVTAHRDDFLMSLRNQTLGDYSVIVDQSYLGIERRHNIIVDCFMEHGASGAPAVSPCGKVVGILTHGLPELFFNLPENEQKVFPPKYRFEIVLKMQYIYNYLKKHRPDLADKNFN